MLCTDRVLFVDVFPRTRCLLLQAQCNFFLLTVDVEDHDFHIVIDLHHLGRMINASPAHIGDVQQAIDSAEIDKRSKIGNVLDDALPQVALTDFRHQRLLHLVAFIFDQLAPRHDDVTPGFVDFQNRTFDFLTNVFADVRRPSNIDLTGRQEHVDADIDQQTALDFADDRAFDHVAFIVSCDHLFPFANAIGFAFGKQNQPDRILKFLQQHLDSLAGIGQVVVIAPVVARNDPFALVADVDKHFVVVDPDHRAFNDFIDVKCLGTLIVHGVHRRFTRLKLAAERLGNILFVYLKLTDEIAVNHYSS